MFGKLQVPDKVYRDTNEFSVFKIMVCVYNKQTPTGNELQWNES